MILSWRSHGSLDAPPLVLLNSIGSTTDMWTPCLAPLAEQFHVVRIDTRGHGGSTTSNSPCTISDLAEDVLSTLDSIGLPRVALAGLSLGGMVGLWIAVHRPERLPPRAALHVGATVD